MIRTSMDLEAQQRTYLRIVEIMLLKRRLKASTST